MKTNTPPSHRSSGTPPPAVPTPPSIGSAIPPTTPHSALRPPHSKVHPSWRHTGKVARLPKAVRDKLNHMLQDGVPCADIIKALGDDGQNLNLANLSRWKDSGYKDWLTEQMFVNQMRLARETAIDLTAKFDSTRITQAALHLATLYIFQALRDLSPGSLDEKLGGDAAAFARLLNALSRSAKETLSLQSRRDTGEAIGNALAGLGLSSLSDDGDKDEDGDEEDADNEDADDHGAPAAPPESNAATTPVRM